MLSEEIKNRTKSMHQLTEKKLVAKMRLINDKKDYASFLNLFYSYFGALELQIKKVLITDRLPDYSLRRKTNLIAEDIITLGFTPSTFAEAKMLPEVNDHLQALGALYVIEGSTLGGQIISGMISKKLNSEEGFLFFKGYENESHQMWRKFINVLNDPANKPAEKIINTAIETFLKFSEWIDVFY